MTVCLQYWAQSEPPRYSAVSAVAPTCSIPSLETIAGSRRPMK